MLLLTATRCNTLPANTVHILLTGHWEMELEQRWKIPPWRIAFIVTKSVIWASEEKKIHHLSYLSVSPVSYTMPTIQQKMFLLMQSEWLWLWQGQPATFKNWVILQDKIQPGYCKPCQSWKGHRDSSNADFLNKHAVKASF